MSYHRFYMHTTKILGTSLIALSLLGIGCNPFASVQERIEKKIGQTVAEKVLEGASGGEGDFQITDEGISVKNKETGEAATFGMGDLPSGFPTDLPRYPGSRIIFATVSGAGKKASLSQTVEGEPAAVYAWYDSQLKAKGYVTESETTGEFTFREYVKGDTKISLTIHSQPSDDGKTYAAITAVYEAQ